MTAWHVALVVTTVWAFVIAIVVILQRRSPAATLAWILVLAFLPVVGWLVFRLIGPQRLARKVERRRASKKIVEELLGALREIDAPGNHRAQLARVAIAAGEAGPLRTEGVELYTEGDDAYRAIAAAIDAAQHHIHAEYYIWEPDRIGTRIRDLLCAKARAGVKVRVVVDATGSAGFRKRFAAPLLAAGAEVAHFNPVSLRRFLFWKRADFRCHRKLVVCDGRVGFTGGINIADAESREMSGAAAWRDTHLRFAGSAVRALQRIFVEDWAFATSEQIVGDEYFPVPVAPATDVIQVIAAGPDAETYSVHRTIFAAINQAADRLWLTTPYYVPDEAIQTAILTAAQRGVDVRLVVPRRGDSRMVDLAARSYFPELIRGGVRVYEFTPRFIHAKTIVVDDDVALVGTANLDNRSFRLDFEILAVLYGHAAAARLAQIFETDLASCEELTVAGLAACGFWSRLGQAGARLFSPLL